MKSQTRSFNATSVGEVCIATGETGTGGNAGRGGHAGRVTLPTKGLALIME